MAERTFYIRFYPDGMYDGSINPDRTPFIAVNEDKEYPLVSGSEGIRIKVVVPDAKVQVTVY